MLEIVEILLGVFTMFFGILSVYVSSNVIQERKKGERIPLVWESGYKFNNYNFKCFDKSCIKYKDGDNT